MAPFRALEILQQALVLVLSIICNRKYVPLLLLLLKGEEPRSKSETKQMKLNRRLASQSRADKVRG